MNAESIESSLNRFREADIRRVKLALTDIDGVLRGKYLDLEKFARLAPETGGFCDCILGWDVDDELYDNALYTGWHTGYPDVSYRLDLDTERKLPGEQVPFFLGDFVSADGQSTHPICPRTVLKRTLDYADSLGFGVRAAVEYEFFVFEETPHSIREKDYKDLRPLSPGMFGYSTIRNSVYADLFHELMDYCLEIGVPLEGLHCETGPGVWEAAIVAADALEAADRAVLFKTFSKVFFQQRGLLATFMAKWSMDYPGQSGHIHQSLLSTTTGEPVFFDRGAARTMSPEMRHYIGGMQTYLKPFLPMIAPTVNDYTRLVKGAWAPTASTWGIDNRTVAIRAIPGSADSQRVETRVAAASGNPYLAMAASIGAGLLGVEQRLEPGDPVSGNAYDVQQSLPDHLQFPTNLRDAVGAFRNSEQVSELFGDAFVEHFAATREWEVREYERAVTDWQLRRYFEII